MQTSNENKEKYQLGDYWLIQFHILQTIITLIVWQIVRRITHEISGVKGESCLQTSPFPAVYRPIQGHDNLEVVILIHCMFLLCFSL